MLPDSMASFTNQEVDEFYQAFKGAYLSLASGVKSYTINVGGSSRSVTRADLPQIKQEFVYWTRIKNKRYQTQSVIDVSYIEPLDN